MKKILSVFCTSVLLFTFSGCESKIIEEVSETQKITEEIPEMETVTAEYSDRYANIRMELSEDWNYAVIDEIMMTDDPDILGRGGIEFWPEDQPDARMGLYYYADPYSICATGVTREELTFSSGHEAILYWEELGESSYAYVFFRDTPGEYVFEAHYIPTEFWHEERETILSILDGAAVGGDALSEEEVLAVAEAECEKFYPSSFRSFDHTTGQWTFRFYVVSDLIKQTVTVNPDGTVAP